MSTPQDAPLRRKEKARRTERLARWRDKRWLETTTRSLLRYVVPLQILDASDVAPSGILNNGTGALIETSRCRFILTAAHVVRAVRQGGVRALLGGGGTHPIDISHWGVIASDDDLDIGTIEIPPEFDPAA